MDITLEHTGWALLIASAATTAAYICGVFVAWSIRPDEVASFLLRLLFASVFVASIVVRVTQ